MLSLNAEGSSCALFYYVILILYLLLYRILIPIIFIPRFAEIWGPTSLSDTARALYRALVRPEGRAFFSQYGEPAKLCQSKSATTSSARFISTSDADKPPQKCNSRYRGLLAAKAHRAVCLSLTTVKTSVRQAARRLALMGIKNSNLSNSLAHFN